ncbi:MULTISPECIES: hypothetical protein [Acinetobacter]|uniref:hypothetical protein n=1 Tax=Acinetobacter TaxID=469 RepID=UPI001F4ADC34|nr:MULTISPECIES: hypothetical protein [Acinetobacter]MCH7379355.1 hypothetical protein [Acinetobacter higginsii]
MSNLSPETLQEMASMRRESERDLTDLVFLLGIASEKLRVLGQKFSYLGSDFADLTTAIRIAKDGAERSQNYHDSEAVRIEIQINKASDSTSNGLLLNEQEK